MKNVIIIIAIFLVALTFYSLTLRGMQGNIGGQNIKNNLDQATKPFELSPERGRYLLVLSMVQNTSFALSRELANAAYPDVGEYRGKYFIYFPPGVSIVALPLFLFGSQIHLSQVGSYFTISIFAALSMLFLYKIGRDIFKFTHWVAVFSSLVFAFASPSWSYAITLYQHHITVFLIVSAFYAVWKYKNSAKNAWIWASYIWLAYASGIWIDYPNAILIAPIMVYFLISSFRFTRQIQTLTVNLKPTIIFTSLIFLSLIVLHGYYNQVNFGSWKRISGGLNGATFLQKDTSNQTASPSALLKLTETNKQVVGFFKEEKLPFGFYTLTISVDRGLFLFSPIFLLAILGIIACAKKRITEETATLLGVIGVNVLLYSSWGDPWGGWAYGPRYLIPSMAILSLFVGVWLHDAKHSVIRRIIALLLFVYSSFIALLGALTTNQVPPKVEADFLHMKYNFLLNWDYFIQGRSGSFAFHEYFSKFLSLQHYFAVLYGSLLVIVLVVLFIIPRFEKNES
jgi:hypothetical protein